MACFPKLYNLDSSVSKGLCLSDLSSEYDDIGDIESLRDIREISISKTRNCSYCNVSFADANEQRAHYKLDWHRYNIKQALYGHQTVPEDAFDTLADDVSSISGSESETSDDETEEERQLARFHHAIIFLENSTGQLYSMFKCLLFNRKDVVTGPVVNNLLSKFLKFQKKWLILMIGGGHFAAAVFDGATIVVHKTYHKYTVRAKQGGSQASQDSKGGSKSAGSSLRRYNEMALSLKIQEILSSWAEQISACSLIFYRAVGPHNGKILFGGKTPPLEKTDSRLRIIPFTTRRATLKEVKRIHDMLSSLQPHGSVAEFKNKYAETVGTSGDVNHKSPKKQQQMGETVNKLFDSPPKKVSPKFIDRAKERPPPQREIPGATEDLESGSDSAIAPDLVLDDMTVNFSDLKEFDNTWKPKKRKKTSGKKKAKMIAGKLEEEFGELQSKLRKLCAQGNVKSLQNVIDNALSWPSREDNARQPTDDPAEETACPSQLKKEDFTVCLNSIVVEETGDTLLHVASGKQQSGVVTLLLNAGCDPTIRNRKNQAPYLIAGDKLTKAAFKDFTAANPGLFDSKLTHIPEPLTEEQLKVQQENKREKKKQQRAREKIQKKENYEKKVDEDDKVRFLALSDREKCAVAAERRLVNSITSNTKKQATPVLVRCFQCGVDITGKVPFEYSTHLFCSVGCLKDHRARTKSYGVEI